MSPPKAGAHVAVGRRSSLTGSFLVVLLIAAALRPPSVRAQVGATTDIITGTVTDSLGNPLRDVVIEALSLETQIARTTRTNLLGRYSLLFPDGGGQYRMTARRIGMALVQTTLVRYADEDRLVWDIRMATQPFLLAPIEVEARLTPVRIPDPPAPGATERNLLPGQVAALPIEPEDLNVLATLVPGVVGLEGTDSTEASFSVAGQRPDANAITLDGMTFRSGNVPQDGLRRTRIITGTYDVSRGRFSGGLIAATSRGGSNRFQSSGNYSLRDDDLAITATGNSPFTSGFTQNRLSGGAGGPIVRNRLFVYASAQGRLRSDPLAALTTATPEDLERLGVAPDSVVRFLDIANALGATTGLVLDESRSNDNLSALLRFDYLLSNDHTLTLRGDLRGTSQDPTQVSRLGLPEAGGTTENGGGGVMARLASRIGLSFLNEAQVYVARSRRDGDPFLFYTPQGRVQVASDLGDGSAGIRTLVLGGSARLPTYSRSTTFEVAEELSWLPGAGRHRFKLGGLVTSLSSNDIRSRNQSGTYAFRSLGALEQGTAATFRRTVAPDERNTRSLEYTLYVGDAFRVSSALQVTYGIRLEGTGLPNPPDRNTSLESAFGRRTDRFPSELTVSPRAGFTLRAGGASARGGRPGWIVRGGAGAFRSPIPTQLAALAQASTGLATSESEVTCNGALVPPPDWPVYGDDPALLPGRCTVPGAGTGAGAGARGRAPTATLFSSDFGAPKAWRASLGFQRSLTSLLRLSMDFTYARGTNQYGFSDLNLNTENGFTLPREAGRSVFVVPGRVAPATGAVRLADSRRDDAFGQVLEIGSNLASDTKQVTVSLGGFTRRGIRVQASYTWQHVRDQSSGSVRLASAAFGSSTTGGNPNVREWSRSDFERRHSFLSTISLPIGTSLEITAIGRLSSGVPYTPLVATDINGDGARNDRAFVFDPNGTAPGGVSSGMANLIGTTSSGARACLERQVGRIAGRNSCIGPWQASFDLQLNYRPRFLGLGGRLQLSLTTVNMLHGIDELLYGSDNLKGWGLRSRPDRTLLFVTGFDQATRQFTYAVNERFGDARAGAASRIAPFQVGIQARFSLGPDRRQAAIDRLRGAGRGGGRPGGAGFGPGARLGGLGSPAEFLDRFRSLFPNPADIVIEMRDSLDLTDQQVSAIGVVGDTLTARNDSLAAELQEDLAAVGTNNPQDLVAVIRPGTQAARTNVLAAVRALREILTEEQWALLPAALRNAGRGRGQRRPGGPN